MAGTPSMNPKINCCHRQKRSIQLFFLFKNVFQNTLLNIIWPLLAVKGHFTINFQKTLNCLKTVSVNFLLLNEIDSFRPPESKYTNIFALRLNGLILTFNNSLYNHVSMSCKSGLQKQPINLKISLITTEDSYEHIAVKFVFTGYSIFFVKPRFQI